MTARDHYQTGAAFRTALEQRLRTEAHASGTPLNRLRKDAAANRLLARLQHVAPDAWALKGGLALITRIGLNVRGTRDADANWRGSVGDLDDALTAIEALDLHDWFSFEIGDARPLQGEGEEGALRYPVTARLDGRTFDQLHIDVNLVGLTDPRPVELVRAQRNPFAFIAEPPLEIPMITPSHQLAEKLHAYVRRYNENASSRAKDLFDMLVIADQVELPNGAELIIAVEQTFRLRATELPPDIPEPPADWAKPWDGFVTDYPLEWRDLSEAYDALRHFWEPILTGQAATRRATWRPSRWRWE